MFKDVVLYGGDVGVPSRVVVARSCGHRRHFGALYFDLQLYVRSVLRLQRAFASIRFQKFFD